MAKVSFKVNLDEITKQVIQTVVRGEPVSHVFLSGFLGESDRKDEYRLYNDISLTSYYIIRENDIIHIEKVNKETSALGGSYIWLKSSAAEDLVLHGEPYGDPRTVGCPTLADRSCHPCQTEYPRQCAPPPEQRTQMFCETNDFSCRTRFGNCNMPPHPGHPQPPPDRTMFNCSFKTYACPPYTYGCNYGQHEGDWWGQGQDINNPYPAQYPPRPFNPYNRR